LPHVIQELEDEFNSEYAFSSFNTGVVDVQPHADTAPDSCGNNDTSYVTNENAMDEVENNEDGDIDQGGDESSLECSEDCMHLQSREQSAEQEEGGEDSFNEANDNENVDPNSPANFMTTRFTSNYSSESPKTTITRTSPPPTASKKSPELLRLEDFLSSPADARNPFEASFDGSGDRSMSASSPAKTSKALFKEMLNSSMQSVDLSSPANLTPSKLSTSLSTSRSTRSSNSQYEQEEGEEEEEEVGGVDESPKERLTFDAFMEPSPVSSPDSSSLGTRDREKVSAMEEMLDSLLREKLSAAEDAERKEVAYSKRLKHAAERETELEDALASVMQATQQDAETIEALQFQ
jgi:hypothetical protein